MPASQWQTPADHGHSYPPEGDDIRGRDGYENGIHGLLKFVKFGYGRASDHASKDIRTGYMTRQEGIEKVRKHDAVVSSDLAYWLNYVDMTTGEFWRIADSFRDPRVWWIEDGQWWKDNIWGEPAPYGRVYLEPELQKRYIGQPQAAPVA